MDKGLSLFHVVSVLVLLTLAVAGGTDPARAEQHSDPQLHYSFEIPPGWIPIPPDVIDETMAAVASQMGIAPQEYEGGFQVDDEYYFEYPYLVIQHFPVDDATIGQLSRALAAAPDTEEVRKLASSDLAGGAAFGEPTVDPSRKMIFMSMEANYEGIGPVRALTVSAPGSQGLVQMHFYALASDYDRQLPVFEALLDSFSFEAGHEYSVTSAVAKSLLFSRMLERGLLGGAIGALVALVALARRNRATRSLSGPTASHGESRSHIGFDPRKS